MEEQEVIPTRNGNGYNDLATGRFVKGNPGRKHGTRTKLNQKLLDRVATRSAEEGLSMEEIIMDIAQNPKYPAELRLKAASKILDVVHPKTASVEMVVEDNKASTVEQIDARIQELLSTGG